MEIALHVGRKLQIRVQLAGRGLPILGDQKYGAGRGFTPGIARHARNLTLEHPDRKEPMTFLADPPMSWRSSGFPTIESSGLLRGGSCRRIAQFDLPSLVRTAFSASFQGRDFIVVARADRGHRWLGCYCRQFLSITILQSYHAGFSQESFGNAILGKRRASTVSQKRTQPNACIVELPGANDDAIAFVLPASPTP